MAALSNLKHTKYALSWCKIRRAMDKCNFFSLSKMVWNL